MVLHRLVPDERRLSGWPVHGCPRCGGTWVPVETLERLLAAPEVKGEVATLAGGQRVHRRQLPRGVLEAKVVYRRCPECDQPMTRRNFARMSGVIVDMCGRDGTYFDAGELEDVLAFVQTGGLALARAKRTEAQKREANRRAHEVPRMPSAFMQTSTLSNEANVLGGFVRWAWRWLRAPRES